MRFENDHAADASMVIDSLKQSKAIRTNPQKLIRHLPEGMNNLYKQSLRSLPPDDREMLIVALRWLMCSEGKIDAVLVADELEPCYENNDDSEDEDTVAHGYKTADVRYESSEESDNGSNDTERESIEILREIGRDFLKFDSSAIDVQYQSVRDFIINEEKALHLDPTLCRKCLERISQESTFQACPKHGHLSWQKVFSGSSTPLLSRENSS